MSISANINTAKTIRDYLASIDQQTKEVTVTITTGASSTTDLTDVDLTWDGQNYYILGTSTEGNVSTTTVYKLDDVLPLSIQVEPKTQTA